MAANQHSTNKATRSQVCLGTLQIEGYLLPDSLWTDANKFAVSKTQAVLLAYPDYDRSHAPSRFTDLIKSKKAQSLIGSGFSIHRKTAVFGENEKADLLPVDHLVTFLKIAKRQGSQAADEILDDLAGLSLQQLFSDAFRIKFDEDDRQEWLICRQKTKDDFWILTASIQDYHDKFPRTEHFRGENYSRVFDALNLGLFGKQARIIKKELGITCKLNRDHFGHESLKRIDMIQRLAQAQIEHHDAEPKQAIHIALGLMAYPVINYRD